MHRRRGQADEVEDAAGILPVGHRVRLEGVDDVGKLHRVTDEEDLQVVTDEIPVAVVRVALDREAARIELVVQEEVTEPVLTALRVDTLDVGLVATTTAVPGIISRKLFQEPFVAYVGAAHRLAGRARISVSDLSPDDLWLLADGHCFRTQVMSLCRQRGRSGASAPRSGTVVLLG